MGEIDDLFREALKGGPLAAVLLGALVLLWRKLSEKDQAMHMLTREVLTALSANTTAMEGLKEAIEARGPTPRRHGGAD